MFHTIENWWKWRHLLSKFGTRLKLYLLSFSDYIKSCASLEVCRQVIVAFDSSGLGRITFSNFKDLMCSLKLWHGVFKNNAKEKSGILIADR